MRFIPVGKCSLDPLVFHCCGVCHTLVSHHQFSTSSPSRISFCVSTERRVLVNVMLERHASFYDTMAGERLEGTCSNDQRNVIWVPAECKPSHPRQPHGLFCLMSSPWSPGWRGDLGSRDASPKTAHRTAQAGPQPSRPLQSLLQKTRGLAAGVRRTILCGQRERAVFGLQEELPADCPLGAGFSPTNGSPFLIHVGFRKPRTFFDVQFHPISAAAWRASISPMNGRR